MAVGDRERWNEKHAAQGAADGEPLLFLQEQLSLIPRGTALDVACGRGRNALFLAAAGFDVLATDVSDVALAALAESAAQAGLKVRTERRDLTREGLPAGAFALVLVARFLERSLFPALPEALAPGGVLVFETFTVQESERSGGRFPRPYCLEPGELRGAFPTLETIAYREETVAGRPIAALLARRPVEKQKQQQKQQQQQKKEESR